MRVICFDERIDQYSVEGLLAKLRQANAPRHVHVDSPGGRFDFFSVLGPAIERQGIVTLSGDVRSAAVLLYLLGHTRHALPDSTFFFHEVRAVLNTGGVITIADMEEYEAMHEKMAGEKREVYQEWLWQMKAAQDWFLHFVSRKTGVSPATFVSLMRAEATLSAREAVHYGIAHRVVAADHLINES